MVTVELNKETCEFIGAFIGDGYFGNYGRRKNIYLIGFTGDKILDKDYLINYLAPLIKRNFPFTNPLIYYKTKENAVILKINSKKLYGWMLKLGFKSGVKARTITIPKIIMKNSEFLNATLRGIFDTDGCLFYDKRKIYRKPYPRITLQLASIALIEQIESHLLKSFKIYVTKSNRDGYRNYIEIYGHKQLEKFLKQIGFSNKRHLNKLMPS